MKMHTDGTIELTVAEYVELEKLRTTQESKPTPSEEFIKQMGQKPNLLPKVTSGATKCPNEDQPCYCTGACMGYDTTNYKHQLYAKVNSGPFLYFMKKEYDDTN